MGAAFGCNIRSVVVCAPYLLLLLPFAQAAAQATVSASERRIAELTRQLDEERAQRVCCVSGHCVFVQRVSRHFAGIGGRSGR